MPRYEFRRDPGWVTVGEGLVLGFRHWRATAIWWAIPVLLVGILSTLVYWGFEATIRDQVRVNPAINAGDFDLGAMLAPMIPQFVISTVILGTISMVASWVYYALAIVGLRGREVTPGWLVGRGLRALAVGLIMLAAGISVVFLVLLTAGAAGLGAALLVAVVAFGLYIYLQVRLVFWSLAIFDGAGIVEGLAGSWRASQGGVTRMVGWAMAVLGVGLLVNIGAAIVTWPLSGAVPIQSGLKAGVTEAFAVFSLFTLAVIYESQLRRTMPERASPVAAPPVGPAVAWQGYAPVGDSAPVDPDAPPGPPPPPWGPGPGQG